MIIWGWRTKTAVHDEGEFYCRHCQAARRYTLSSNTVYFTLFFFPIFPLRRGSQYVHCSGCGRELDAGSLHDRAPKPQDEHGPAIRAALKSGASLQKVRSQLLEQGLEPPHAEALILAVAGSEFRRCYDCQLTFPSATSQCSACGAALRDA